MLWDFPPGGLDAYRGSARRPEDFEEFWSSTVADARAAAWSATRSEVLPRMATIRSWDVRFPGFGGDPIRAWLNVPAGAVGPLACVVECIGYGGGRGLPHDWLFWSAAGFAHLIVDSRGQGSQWRSGDTPDADPLPTDPAFPGFLTRGISSPDSYYYRRLITDAVRAVDAAAALPEVDADRIAVAGTSQGGGVAIATAALHERVALLLADVPFLCDFRRAATITDSMPYGEIGRYLRMHRSSTESVFATLDYFDGVNFAAMATAPALFAVAAMDTISPPSTVWAAHNSYAGPHEIVVWPFNDHESGESEQRARELRFVRDRFAIAP